MHITTRSVHTDFNVKTFFIVDHLNPNKFVIYDKQFLECNHLAHHFYHGEDETMYKCIINLTDKELKELHNKFLCSNRFVEFTNKKAKVYVEQETNRIAYNLTLLNGVVTQYESTEVKLDKMDWLAAFEKLNVNALSILSYAKLNEIAISRIKNSLDVVEKLTTEEAKEKHFTDEWIYNNVIAPTIHKSLYKVIMPEWLNRNSTNN